MTVYDWVAIVGAGAWLPQIVSWISKAAARPKLRLTLGPLIEAGYTIGGPALNLYCSFAISKKDALLDDLKCTIRHEKGQAIELRWLSLSETFSQWKSASGESAEVSKQQPAIALKLSTLGLVEKVVSFHDPSFQAEFNRLTFALESDVKRFKRAGADLAKEVSKSASLDELGKYARASQPWQAGKYAGVIRARFADVKDVAEFTFSFRLAEEDVERMAENVTTLTSFAEEALIVAPEEIKTKVEWKWAYPGIESQDPRT